jgi:hypothetical protein
MEISELSKWLDAGSCLIALLMTFLFLERWGLQTGKQTLADKFIKYLEDLYSRTDPDNLQLVKVQECELLDHVNAIKLQYSGQSNCNLDETIVGSKIEV